MTKADIIESVYEKVGFSKKEAAEVVEMVFDTIKETLERGEKIKISGFGNFIIRDKKSRVGRNPQTGEEIEISARRVLTFRPSQVLKNALNSAAEARWRLPLRPGSGRPSTAEARLRHPGPSRRSAGGPLSSALTSARESQRFPWAGPPADGRGIAIAAARPRSGARPESLR